MMWSRRSASIPAAICSHPSTAKVPVLGGAQQTSSMIALRPCAGVLKIWNVSEKKVVHSAQCMPKTQISCASWFTASSTDSLAFAHSADSLRLRFAWSPYGKHLAIPGNKDVSTRITFHAQSDSVRRACRLLCWTRTRGSLLSHSRVATTSLSPASLTRPLAATWCAHSWFALADPSLAVMI